MEGHYGNSAGVAHLANWLLQKGNLGVIWRCLECNLIKMGLTSLQTSLRGQKTTRTSDLLYSSNFPKKAWLGDVKNHVPPKTLQCSTISGRVNLKPTFSSSPLSYASIDVLWSHFDNSKPYFAMFSKRVFFLDNPVFPPFLIGGIEPSWKAKKGWDLNFAAG